jgi:hypothetical protein
LHVVCPPTFVATRQHCGGVCREELGGLWVAFFLCRFWNIKLWRKNIIQRASSAQLVQRSGDCTALTQTWHPVAGLVVA